MSEIWNLSTLCRCCHADGYFKSLNLQYEFQNDVEIYEIMLRETLGITISMPPLEASYTICDRCIQNLRNATDFKKQVLMCEQKFKVYCTNEQFLNTPETVKFEVEEHNNIDDDNEVVGCDDNMHTDTKVILEIKQEFNIEVDIKHPINEVKKEVYLDRNTNDYKENIVKKKRIIKRPNNVSNRKIKREILHYNNIDNSLVTQVETEKGVHYSCKTCGGYYQTKKQIHCHIYSEHSPPIKCEHCHKQLKNPTSLRTHMKLHTGTKFKCPYCTKIFTNGKTLEEHINSHTKEKVFTCDICKKDFNYKQTLRKHLKWHAGLNKVKLCDICGRSFNDQSNLTIHIQAVHEKLRPYGCNYCGKTYTAKKHLKNHLRIHVEGKGEKSHQCDVCERKFACPKTMKIHRMRHENKFMCKYCAKIFDDRIVYTDHVRVTHQEKHGCGMCGKTFTSKYSLNRHLDDHKGIKRFGCEICNIKFSQKAMLIRHNYRKHNPDNIEIVKTKCDICKKMFRNIKSHMESHTNRKFACEICGKTYPGNNTLTRHKLQVHFGRTFDCDVCGKKYMQNAKLTTHKRKVHKFKEEMQDSVENVS